MQSGHCWLPEKSRRSSRASAKSFVADGAGFKGPQPSELADREWRADPSDGMRPLRHIRDRHGSRPREPPGRTTSRASSPSSRRAWVRRGCPARC